MMRSMELYGTMIRELLGWFVARVCAMKLKVKR